MTTAPVAMPRNRTFAGEVAPDFAAARAAMADPAAHENDADVTIFLRRDDSAASTLALMEGQSLTFRWLEPDRAAPPRDSGGGGAADDRGGDGSGRRDHRCGWPFDMGGGRIRIARADARPGDRIAIGCAHRGGAGAAVCAAGGRLDARLSYWRPHRCRADGEEDAAGLTGLAREGRHHRAGRG